jgi:hypothetical protein
MLDGRKKKRVVTHSSCMAVRMLDWWKMNSDVKQIAMMWQHEKLEKYFSADLLFRYRRLQGFELELR